EGDESWGVRGTNGEHAVLRVERLQHANPARDSLRQLADDTGEFQSCATRIGLVCNRLRHELHDVMRELARREVRAALDDAADAIGAERTPVLALQVPRDQVPAAGRVREADALDVQIAFA